MSIRLIADENISWRIKKMIPEWNILPANEIKPSQRLSDLLIWKFAKENQYTILTFDEDFSELQNLFSFSPKIIWLRTGNIGTEDIGNCLLKLEKEIIHFHENDEAGIYEIYL